MAFLLVRYHLNPWLVLAVGVPGSALGRFLFSIYIPKLSEKVMARRKKEDLRYLGKKLDRPLWQTWLFVFLYTVSPLSTSALFTAAGITKVPVARLIPPFVAGKFLSDGAMVWGGRYAASSIGDVIRGVLGWKSLLISGVTVLVTGALMFIDWHALLATKTLRFNFSIWK